MKRALTFGLVFVAAIGAGAACKAGPTGFDGSAMTLFYDFPALGTHFDTRAIVVGPGVEAPNFPTGDPRTNIDVSNTNIFVTYNSTATWTSAAYNGFVLFDSSGTVPDILGVSINAATNMAGLDATRVTFDANNVYVNWQGLSFNTSTIVSIDVRFQVDAIPEPGTLAAAGTGVLALLGYGWRRRRKATA